METSPLRRWPRADLRVGDEDRQRVVDELQRHYIAGRLNSEELGERVSQALAAKTFGDLAALLSDLPDEQPEPTLTPVEPHRAQHDHADGFAIPPALMMVIALCAIAVITMLVFMPGQRGVFSFWPFIWVFFFFGWPRGGRRRHF